MIVKIKRWWKRLWARKWTMDEILSEVEHVGNAQDRGEFEFKLRVKLLQLDSSRESK